MSGSRFLLARRGAGVDTQEIGKRSRNKPGRENGRESSAADEFAAAHYGGAPEVSLRDGVAVAAVLVWMGSKFINAVLFRR